MSKTASFFGIALASISGGCNLSDSSPSRVDESDASTGSSTSTSSSSGSTGSASSGETSSSDASSTSSTSSTSSSGGEDTGGMPDVCMNDLDPLLGHRLEIVQFDLDAGVQKTYDIRGTASHSHLVVILDTNFATLNLGDPLTVVSTEGGTDNHTHTITVQCEPSTTTMSGGSEGESGESSGAGETSSGTTSAESGTTGTTG